MKTVYRYEISNVSGINKVQMPSNAKILSVGFSNGNTAKPDVLSLWALVESTDPTVERTFIVAGTGANLDDALTFDNTFIGTATKMNSYAFHVFEVRDNNNIF